MATPFDSLGPPDWSSPPTSNAGAFRDTTTINDSRAVTFHARVTCPADPLGILIEAGAGGDGMALSFDATHLVGAAGRGNTTDTNNQTVFARLDKSLVAGRTVDIYWCIRPTAPGRGKIYAYDADGTFLGIAYADVVGGGKMGSQDSIGDWTGSNVAAVGQGNNVRAGVNTSPFNGTFASDMEAWDNWLPSDFDDNTYSTGPLALSLLAGGLAALFAAAAPVAGLALAAVFAGGVFGYRAPAPPARVAAGVEPGGLAALGEVRAASPGVARAVPPGGAVSAVQPGAPAAATASGVPAGGVVAEFVAPAPSAGAAVPALPGGVVSAVEPGAPDAAVSDPLASAMPVAPGGLAVGMAAAAPTAAVAAATGPGALQVEAVASGPQSRAAMPVAPGGLVSALEVTSPALGAAVGAEPGGLSVGLVAPASSARSAASVAPGGIQAPTQIAGAVPANVGGTASGGVVFGPTTSAPDAGLALIALPGGVTCQFAGPTVGVRIFSRTGLRPTWVGTATPAARRLMAQQRQVQLEGVPDVPVPVIARRKA